jgi:hypothetical protein
MTFDEKLEEVFQELCRARKTYEAWWNLRNTKVWSRYLHAMNVYSEYFRVAVHSHFVAMLMALFRLYDTDRRALSLPRLVAALQSEPAVPRAVRLTAERSVARSQPTLDKMRVLRDKVFAHHDRAYSHERAFREAKLTGNEVRRILDRSLRAVNLLMEVRGKGTYSFGCHTQKHLLRMLDDLDSFDRSQQLTSPSGPTPKPRAALRPPPRRRRAGAHT